MSLLKLFEVMEGTSVGVEKQDAGEDVQSSNVDDSQAQSLSAILALACAEVEGISAKQMESLLNDDDKREILAGLIPASPTLKDYAKSFARGIRGGRIVLLSRGDEA